MSAVDGEPSSDTRGESSTADPRRAWLVFAAMAMPVFALSMDVNGIGMLLPSIHDTFPVSSGSLAWVVNASALTMSALLIPVGRLAPRVGDRRLVLTGVVVFTSASLVSATAPTFPWLIVGRVGQGLGGVLMFATSLAVISSAFDARRRPAAVGAWGAVNGVGAALGPLVSGALASWWTWRGFFLINIPIGLAAWTAIVTLVPRDRPASAVAASVPWRRLGVLGAGIVLATVGCQNSATYGWLEWHTIGALAAAALLVAWLVHTARRGAPPVVSAIVRRAPFTRAAAVGAFTSNWGFGVTIVAMGAYLQTIRGMSAVHAGVVFMVFSALCAVAGVLVSRLVRRRGLRRALTGGLALATVGLLLASALDVTTPMIAVALALAVGGLGQGLSFDLTSLAALDRVPEPDASEATSVVSTVRGFGMTTGIALSTTVSAAVAHEVSGDGELAAFRSVMLLAGAVAAVGVVAVVRLAPRPGGLTDLH